MQRQDSTVILDEVVLVGSELDDVWLDDVLFAGYTLVVDDEGNTLVDDDDNVLIYDENN